MMKRAYDFHTVRNTI